MPQFALLVAVNALVGGMIGQERTVLPLLARDTFGLTASSAVLTFLVAFGLVKAAANLVAGHLADRVGRRRVLIAGWLAGVPVPLLLIWAPSWSWVVLANGLLGVNQGLAWSMTVTMKVDLVGERRRGLAMGLNEAAGYGAVAASALLTGLIAARHGLRPEPFYLGLAFIAIGLGLSVVFIRETRPPGAGGSVVTQRMRDVFVYASVRERALSACAQAGFVNNLNDGMVWGLLPLWFARGGLSIASIGVLAALYPAVWGLGQLVTGAVSDRIGRKTLIVAGMLMQAAGIAVVAATGTFAWWACGSIALGAGTAMVYPTLLAAVGDVAEPSWRASAIGVYRFWRDAGFAAGALFAGLIADAFGMQTAIWAVAGVTAASGVVVASRMYETLDVR